MLVTILRWIAGFPLWVSLLADTKHYELVLFDLHRRPLLKRSYPKGVPGRLAALADFESFPVKDPLCEAVFVIFVNPLKPNRPRLIARRMGLTREGYRYGGYRTGQERGFTVIRSQRAAPSNQAEARKSDQIARLQVIRLPKSVDKTVVNSADRTQKTGN